MKTNDTGLALVVAIVPEGSAKKVIRTARENNLSGATVFFGRGTCQKGILTFLCLDNPKREIVLMAGGAKESQLAMQAIYSKLKMAKSGQGIIYSCPLGDIIGSSTAGTKSQNEGSVPSVMKAIYTIVDRGKADLVLDSAFSAGATGATIINARGSGIHETEKIFQMPIEPEKEIVLILADNDLVDKITDKIRKDLEIDLAGKGIIFVHDVAKAYGLRSDVKNIKA